MKILNPNECKEKKDRKKTINEVEGVICGWQTDMQYAQTYHRKPEVANWNWREKRKHTATTQKQTHEKDKPEQKTNVQHPSLLGMNVVNLGEQKLRQRR